MPLYELNGTKVTKVPFAREFQTYQSRLTTGEWQAIVDWINNRIDSNEIHTAGWMPGANWQGTVFEPIYTKSAKQDTSLAGKCFGLFVYVVFMNRSEDWYSGRFELNGRDIGSRTYFQKRP
ncbi:MAG: hypothetical protein Q8S73_13560 [Deltaproteobacteria bacterium]|nr:hypothetical protein [Myxococcales bacterium]MDP3215128.1 hypothetical protein [Deltaproteobacteria bacterium]